VINQNAAMLLESCSLVGKRSSNDDSVKIILGKFRKKTYTVCIVADGIGSKEGSGKVARAICDKANVLASEFFSLRNSRKPLGESDTLFLKSSIIEALRKIELPTDLGSTVVGFIIYNRGALIFWAGDSRIYGLRNDGKLDQLTRDHVVNEIGPEITGYINGRGEMLGDFSIRYIDPSDYTVFAAMTDGLSHSCGHDELRKFLGYCASRIGSNAELESDVVAFLAGNIDDNASLGIVKVARKMRRAVRAIF
jgi:serine/threonine protein phosphatase PrpC